MLTFDEISKSMGEILTKKFDLKCYTDVVPQNAVRPSAFLWAKKWTMTEDTLESMVVHVDVAIDLLLPFAADEFADASAMAQVGATVGALFCGQDISVGDDYTIHVEGVQMAEPLASVVPITLSVQFLDDLADSISDEVYELLTQFKTNNEELNLL